MLELLVQEETALSRTRFTAWLDKLEFHGWAAKKNNLITSYRANNILTHFFEGFLSLSFALFPVGLKRTLRSLRPRAAYPVRHLKSK